MKLPSRRAQAAIAFVLAVAAFVFWWLSRPDPLPASAIPAHTPISFPFRSHVRSARLISSLGVKPPTLWAESKLPVIKLPVARYP